MATITDIMTVPWANLTSFAGVAKASITNIGDPTGPTPPAGHSYTLPTALTKSVPSSGNFMWTPAVIGNRAYGWMNDYIYRIYDISNLSSPTLLGSFNPGWTNSSSVWAVTNQGMLNNCVFVSLSYTSTSTLYVVAIDVSNPAAPYIRSTLTVGTNGYGSPMHGFVRGNYLYLNHSVTSTVKIINVSNPDSMSVTSSVAGGGSWANFDQSGNYWYVASSSGKNLKIYDISNPASPSLVGQTTAWGSGNWDGPVMLDGTTGYAYTTSGTYLVAINVSNPASPSVVGSYNFGANCSVVVRNGFLFVFMNDYPTIHVVNKSNPASLSIIESKAVPYPPGNTVFYFYWMANWGSNWMPSGTRYDGFAYGNGGQLSNGMWSLDFTVT